MYRFISKIISVTLELMQELAGVYLSGIAGSLTYRRVRLHMIATDLIEELSNAMKAFVIINCYSLICLIDNLRVEHYWISPKQIVINY
jgi:hypothetical protein